MALDSNALGHPEVNPKLPREIAAQNIERRGFETREAVDGNTKQ